MKERVAILGSTGSIGMNTLSVVRAHPDRFRVVALTANGDSETMLAQCREFRPLRVVMVNTTEAFRLRTLLADDGLDVEVLSGARALDEMANDADTVVCAIVGAAGLPSTLSAVRAGARVLIANKEPLVMLGGMIMQLARQHQATILPLDSEHNAIFQCLPAGMQSALGDNDQPVRHGIRRLILTGSGGPFRERDPSTFPQVTVEQACAHPNWRMGPKISVDSATMMNKGLELIEACALYAMGESSVDIVIHPQSVVHSIVEYVDGSMLAQMANPDMRVPIANALAWPERIASGAEPLDLLAASRFDFEAPDHQRFPALDLAREAARSGGTAPALLNAANEIAVAAFLAHEIGFHQITELVAATMDKLPVQGTLSPESIMQADSLARETCQRLVASSPALAGGNN